MYHLDVNITIGSHTFDFVTAGEISTSWKTLTDTAKFTLPRNIKKFWGGDNQFLQELVKRGDEVEIKLGYDGNLETEFVGFISDVKMGRPPVEIECEDLMWSLKQETVNESYKTVKLKKLVEDITFYNRYIEDIVVDDVDLGAFRIEDQSPAAVLEYLKNSYGLKSFFRGKTLYVGFAYPADQYKKITYDFQQNVKEEGNSLVYKSADDIKLKVKAISIMEDDNEKIEVELGDPDGAVRTLHFYNLSKAHLEHAAQSQMDLLKYDGFRGSFKCFGIPHPAHGDIADIKDQWYPEHKGAYFIDRVVTRFGVGIGIDREIHLGLKASGNQIEEAN